MTFDEYVQSVAPDNKTDKTEQASEKQDFSWLNMKVRKTKKRETTPSDSEWFKYILAHPLNN